MGKTTEKITPSMKETLLSLYNEGKMDTEIANVLNVSRSAICYWRKQLGLKTRFTYSKIAKLDIEKHKDLLLNKEGSIILFIKSKMIFPKQLKHISIYLIVI